MSDIKYDKSCLAKARATLDEAIAAWERTLSLGHLVQMPSAAVDRVIDAVDKLHGHAREVLATAEKNRLAEIAAEPVAPSKKRRAAKPLRAKRRRAS